MSMRPATVHPDAGFIEESLRQRRASSRRFGAALAVLALILYVGGFWLQR